MKRSLGHWIFFTFRSYLVGSFHLRMIIFNEERTAPRTTGGFGAKAMELCRAWSKGQSTYINKPGLRLYSQMDSEGNAIPAKNIWMHDPEEFPEEVPLADCFVNYSEND